MNARDQVARLLALAPYLQAREGGVPLAQVAADFGVPPAQIVRDLQVLYMCGLPGLGPGDLVEIDFESFEDDPDGLVRIDNAEFLTRPLRLGSSEAAALIVALRALRESSPEESREVIDRTLRKLEDANTGDAAPPPVQVHGSPELAAERRTAELLERAIAADHQVRLTYYVPSRDEATERVVDPLAVLSDDRHGYLDAWCHQAEARRLFRLSRIESADELFDPRREHDVAPRDLSEGLFEPGPDDLTVLLRVAPEARWVAEYYPVEGVRSTDGDAVEVTMRVGDPQWLVRLALRLSPHVDVVAPADLAAVVASARRAALDLYRDDAAGPAGGHAAGS